MRRALLAMVVLISIGAGLAGVRIPGPGGASTTSTPIALTGTAGSCANPSTSGAISCNGSGSGVAVSDTLGGATAGRTIITGANESSGPCTVITQTGGSGTQTCHPWTTAVTGQRLQHICTNTGISSGDQAFTNTASSGCASPQFVQSVHSQWDGIAAGDPVDQVGTPSTEPSATTSHTSPSITSTIAKSLFIAQVDCDSALSTISGVKAGWVKLSFLDSTGFNYQFYHISSSIETNFLTFTSAAGVRCTLQTINFKGN